MTTMGEDADRYVRVSEDGLSLDLKFAHLQRHDFNPYGYISPWRLGQMFEAGRTIGHYMRSYFTSRLLKEGYTFFTIIQDYEITPALYQLDNEKPFETGMFVPIKLHHQMLSFKNTSGIFLTTLYDDRSGKEMANLKLKYVLVNRKTRRPAQLPPESRKHIQSSRGNETISVPDVSYKIHHPPPNAYKCEFAILSSDSDSNGHTNNTTYLRICFDAVAQALKENKLPWMIGSLVDYRVMQAKLYFAKECKEGDNLVVLLWGNNEDRDIVHFVFRLKQQDIFYGTLKFKHKSLILSAKL